MSEQLLSNSIERTIAELEAENARLRQQLAEAQGWQPVEDGVWQHEIIMRNNEIGFSNLAIEGGQIITISNSDTVEIAVHSMNDDLRLCRRVEPEWLDAPDGEGEWAWKSENGKWIGFVKNTQWGMSYRAITNIANYVYEFLVEEMPMGKWQRLDIAWPKEETIP